MWIAPVPLPWLCDGSNHRDSQDQNFLFYRTASIRQWLNLQLGGKPATVLWRIILLRLGLTAAMAAIVPVTNGMIYTMIYSYMLEWSWMDIASSIPQNGASRSTITYGHNCFGRDAWASPCPSCPQALWATINCMNNCCISVEQTGKFVAYKLSHLQIICHQGTSQPTNQGWGSQFPAAICQTVSEVHSVLTQKCR